MSGVPPQNRAPAEVPTSENRRFLGPRGTRMIRLIREMKSLAAPGSLWGPVSVIVEEYYMYAVLQERKGKEKKSMVDGLAKCWLAS